MKIKDRNELEELQKAVLEANLLLYRSKLALHTWEMSQQLAKIAVIML
ncbi:hypothetical protein CIB43_00770 [Mesomycoplasma hyopneumoniae]|uniref:Uncharacterized protein n=1 Tax=Mesomycoplasma hyopneumoniae TaxID=2099 RepID=A0A223MB28_MESHO|nr:hypothetical protein CIB43_00770 [Mesomycoplasma hyopneumoniae]